MTDAFGNHLLQEVHVCKTKKEEKKLKPLVDYDNRKTILITVCYSLLSEPFAGPCLLLSPGRRQNGPGRCPVQLRLGTGMSTLMSHFVDLSIGI